MRTNLIDPELMQKYHNAQWVDLPKSPPELPEKHEKILEDAHRKYPAPAGDIIIQKSLDHPSFGDATANEAAFETAVDRHRTVHDKIFELRRSRAPTMQALPLLGEEKYDQDEKSKKKVSTIMTSQEKGCSLEHKGSWQWKGVSLAHVKGPDSSAIYNQPPCPRWIRRRR